MFPFQFEGNNKNYRITYKVHSIIALEFFLSNQCRKKQSVLPAHLVQQPFVIKTYRQ